MSDSQSAKRTKWENKKIIHLKDHPKSKRIFWNSACLRIIYAVHANLMTVKPSLRYKLSRCVIEGLRLGPTPFTHLIETALHNSTIRRLSQEIAYILNLEEVIHLKEQAKTLYPDDQEAIDTLYSLFLNFKEYSFSASRSAKVINFTLYKSPLQEGAL